MIVAAAVVGVAAYLGVRIGSSSPSFWEALTIEGNLARLIQWMGLATMAVVYLIWRRVCRLAGLDGPLQRRAVWWFWVCARVTSLLTGYDCGCGPLVVCEPWLVATRRRAGRHESRVHEHHGNLRSDVGRPTQRRSRPAGAATDQRLDRTGRPDHLDRIAVGSCEGGIEVHRRRRVSHDGVGPERERPAPPAWRSNR